MKKSAVVILLVLTLAFATFVAGFYVGRNYDKSTIQISGVEKITQPTSPGNSPPSTCATVPATLDAETVAILEAINTATLEDWIAVPDIGPTTAENILQYRSQYGDFKMPQDLDHVKGIGPKTIETIMEYFRGRLNNEDIGS